MSTLSEQIKNFNEMKNSKQKQKEFNDRMVNLTWKYQKIYKFQTRDKKGNEFWNNEADAFKHTFGSALMEFEMGSLGSLLGGIYHEGDICNNPPGEYNMDSWNNREGRKIAQEIKKEYGEKNFRNFPKEKQEDIIAQKVMVRLKNGDLITNPNDKRKFVGMAEEAGGWLMKMKNSKSKQQSKAGTPTGFAAHINNSTDPFIQGFKDEPKDTITPSQRIANEIDNDEWDNNDIAFLEGFHSDEPDKHLITQAKQRRKEKAKQTGTKGKGPKGEDGYWYTTKKGKHVFVPEDKIA